MVLSVLKTNNYEKIPILVLLIGFSIHLFGQEVTETIARQVANGYYEKVQYDNTQDYVQTVKAALATRADRFPERVSPMGKAEMWLVPVPDGWVLVSTNMKTPPILAHYQTMFFNLSGQLVLQTAEKEVDVSNLSPGAYIVRALLVNGETRQTKIVHL